MPDTFPNPYATSSPLGDALKQLGTVIMSGPTDAQRISQAEDALKKQGQRLGGDSLANMIRQYGTPAYNDNATMASALQAGVNPEHVAQGVRFLATNKYGVASPEATNSYVGAGGSYTGTAQGQRDITDRGIAQQRYQFDNTFETLRAPDGKLVPVARNKVADAVGQGYTIQPSVDQVSAGLLQKSLASGSQTAAQSPGTIPMPQTAAQTAPQAPGAVSTDPLYNLPPSAQHMLKISTTPVPMVDTRSNRVGLSYDGGRSVVDQQTGQVAPSAGGGWVPAGPEGAVGESRTALVKNAATQPTAYPPWTQGEYAQSAAKVQGPDAFAQKHANALFGSLGLTGGGEIGPAYERARANLEILNQTVLGAFMNSPTNPIKEQSRIRAMLPSENFLANPTTEANTVGTLVRYLQADHDRLRSLVASNATTGPILQQAQQALIQNEKALSMMTAPAQGAPGGPATPPPPSSAPGASPSPVEQWQRGPDGRPMRVQ